MGPLYGGDAVHAAVRCPKCVPPAASFDTSGFKMAIGTNHAAPAGDTRSMDLQVCPSTRSVNRHTDIGTQGGNVEGNRAPACSGRRGAGAEEDKFLLECNFDELVTTNGEQQEYWILAVQAAREACRLRAAARGTLNAAGTVAPRHDNHLSAAGAVALRHRAIPCAAGAVASRQGTQNIAAGAVVPWQGTNHGAAGAEAR